MSAEATVQKHIELPPDNNLIHCPNCGFKVPDSIVICWKCGQRLKK